MNVFNIVNSLAPIDLRNIRRDNSLKWMIFIPILMALFLRWGVPPISDRLMEEYGFFLTPYYPVFIAYFFVINCPLVFAVLTGLLLLDEKDDNTLTALQVTPLSLNRYIAYRVAIPVLLTIMLMFIIFPIANIVRFDPVVILWTAIVAAPIAPMVALFIATYAQNKVQGFALLKLSGIVLLAPIPKPNDTPALSFKRSVLGETHSQPNPPPIFLKEPLFLSPVEPDLAEALFLAGGVLQ